MPADGVSLSPRSELMNAEEVYQIANTFVKQGVTKIRLTGGEPLVRKDFRVVLQKLASLNVELSISSNGILIDRFFEEFKEAGLQKINISLDSLRKDRFKGITRFDKLNKVIENIDLALANNFKIKINVVLIKGFNDDEVIDLVNFAKNRNISIRFIEFMPFDGNAWNNDQVVTENEILEICKSEFGPENILTMDAPPNSTSRNFKIKNHQGSFGMISTVSNPFCDSCNRIRLTANGKIKNCLFSNGETDLLGPLRNDQSIDQLIKENIRGKHASRGGLDTIDSFLNPTSHVNRSMIMIGG